MAHPKHLCDGESHKIVAGVFAHLSEERSEDAFETVTLYVDDMVKLGYPVGEVFHSLFRAALRVTMNVVGKDAEMWRHYVLSLASLSVESGDE